MTRRRWITTAALGSLALLLVVLGAAIRPLVVPDDSPPTPVLNATEIAFVQDMTAHHQQALIMVQRLGLDVDPTVLRLAQQIADTQRLEIGTMLGWLRLAQVTPTNPHPMAWMHDSDHPVESGRHHPARTPTTNPATPMPGMATMAELDALSAAHGRDAETLFLQLMRNHHYGGIAMAQAIDEQLASGPVKYIARDMISTQSQEAGIIGLLLTQHSAQAPG
ncbi:DUF305 domain-containing protein [Nocardia abscessus]|uniref:DUF305 domain-containing protein n=1 Tax=Nocardia abscessus TaxID=120957 RepID=UPI00031EC7F3|nr:DUF305 domain-containing protein [Nocardia abscessus]MCC3331523.1 DUF305 domain-containing protein [Nocardia abscessus]